MATSISQRFEKSGDFFLLQDTDLRGGLRVVGSIAERDAIPLAARKQGMMVRVVDATTGTIVTYEIPFGSPITNAGWAEAKLGGGGDFIPTAGGALEGELALSPVASIKFSDALKCEIIDQNLQFTSLVVGQSEDDPEPRGMMTFNNGTDNTVEINTLIGQIVCKTEVALASDRTLKTEIKRIQKARDILNRMHGYTFKKIGDDRLYTGLIAQEVQQVFPEAVCRTSDGKLAVFYGSFAGLFVEALNDLFARVEKIEERLDVLEKL